MIGAPDDEDLQPDMIGVEILIDEDSDIFTIDDYEEYDIDEHTKIRIYDDGRITIICVNY